MEEYLLGVITHEVIEEYKNSMKKFPEFNTPHEGYAVIKEEVDELWEEVREKEHNYEKMEKECIQIAAMAVKFIMMTIGKGEEKI